MRERCVHVEVHHQLQLTGHIKLIYSHVEVHAHPVGRENATCQVPRLGTHSCRDKETFIRQGIYGRNRLSEYG